MTFYPGCTLENQEVIKDSPSFRSKILANERFFDKLQKRLDETLRLVDAVAEHGQNFVASFYNLTASVNGLWADMNIRDEEAIRTNKLMSEALSNIVYLNKTVIERAFPGLKVSLENFMKKDLVKLNETRNHFDALSNSLNEAVAKKAAINKHKTQDLLEAKNSLTAFGTCFAHNSLDYVAQLNIAHVRKCHVILEAHQLKTPFQYNIICIEKKMHEKEKISTSRMLEKATPRYNEICVNIWTFVNEYSTFFRKGYTFFNDKSEICFTEIVDSIDMLKNRVMAVERKTQDRHAVVPKEVFQHPTGMPSDPQVVMEGYLFKRSTNAFKTWNRRWFMIREDKLLYSHKSVEGEVPTVMEENLKLCLVRPSPPSVERACCFELVTPSKNHLLQADSESLCNAWIRALQRTIQNLHEDDRSFQTPRLSFLDSFEQTSSFVNSLVVPSGSECSSANKSHEGQNNTRTSQNSMNTMPSTIKFKANSKDLSTHNEKSSYTVQCKSTGNQLPTQQTTTAFNLNSAENHEVKNIPTLTLISSNKSEMLQFLRTLMSISGNDRCADCGMANPKWVSINLGVIVCIECSGAHRSLGVHRSKVRSLTMDSLDAEQRNILLQLGNNKVNAIYLENLSKQFVNSSSINEHSSRESREQWIILKYVDKKFVKLEYEVDSKTRSTSMTDMAGYGITHFNSYFSQRPLADEIESEVAVEMVQRKLAEEQEKKLKVDTSKSKESTDLIGDGRRISRSVCASPEGNPIQSSTSDTMAHAIKFGDLERILRVMICANFDLNRKVNSTYPLHLAVQFHRLTVIEFLMLNDAKANNIDDDWNTALHVAAKMGHTIEVYQLLKRYADKSLKNKFSQTPLSLAVEKKHADIVTLLRLHEMRETCNDDMNSTMNDVDKFIGDLIARQMLNDRDEHEMGNCLPFFQFLSNNSDDTTRLDNLNASSSQASGPPLASDLNQRTFSDDSSGDRNRQRYRRNLQPSSYVNELYANSAHGVSDEESITEKALDEKRKARVRGLLEQINVDYYIKGGKGDDECAICMVDFMEYEAIRYLPCMHSYHLKCIDAWLLRSFTCPSCMEPVDSAILSAFTVNSVNTNLSALPCSAASLEVLNKQ